jgi:hypothetical protein
MELIKNKVELMVAKATPRQFNGKENIAIPRMVLSSQLVYHRLVKKQAVVVWPPSSNSNKRLN